MKGRIIVCALLLMHQLHSLFHLPLPAEVVRNETETSDTVIAVDSFRSMFFVDHVSYDSIKTAAQQKKKVQDKNCGCVLPKTWTAQAGQDRYLYERIFSQQSLCCNGTFVEFGARNGIEHSNTYPFEKFMGWKGLLFEVDPREYPDLQRNRNHSHVISGPVCPSTMKNVTITLAQVPGWTGAQGSYEPTRINRMRDVKNYQCYHLAEELSKHGMRRVDYMTIDTEGSELEIIKDFPWHKFDIRVVQIEQLNQIMYPAQAGKKKEIIKHMQQVGYELLSVYAVEPNDTDDLIFTRNIDRVVGMSKHPRDGGNMD